MVMRWGFYRYSIASLMVMRWGFHRYSIAPLMAMRWGFHRYSMAPLMVMRWIFAPYEMISMIGVGLLCYGMALLMIMWWDFIEIKGVGYLPLPCGFKVSVICGTLEAEQGSRESRHPLLVGSVFEDPYFRDDRKLSLLLWLIPFPSCAECTFCGGVALWRKWRCGASGASGETNQQWT